MARKQTVKFPEDFLRIMRVKGVFATQEEINRLKSKIRDAENRMKSIEEGNGDYFAIPITYQEDGTLRPNLGTWVGDVEEALECLAVVTGKTQEVKFNDKIIRKNPKE